MLRCSLNMQAEKAITEEIPPVASVDAAKAAVEIGAGRTTPPDCRPNLMVIYCSLGLAKSFD